MEIVLSNLRWFKSSASASGACVEVAHLPGGGVAVRDSKDRSKAPHVYTRREWEAFLAGAKAAARSRSMASERVRTSLSFSR